MKKGLLIILTLFLSLVLVSAYPITGKAIESDDQTITAGITPDSIWYGLDVALDNINLALTSEDKKAEKGLLIARERLLETKQMIKENKIEKAKKSQKNHEEVLLKAQESIEKIKSDNSINQISKEIEIETEFQEHKNEIQATIDELNLKMKVDNELSGKELLQISTIFAKLKKSNQLVETEISEQKEETKLKIKDESENTEIEVENQIKAIEEEKGLIKLQETKAIEEINDLEKDIIKTELETELPLASEELSTATDLLAQAKDALQAEDYEAAKEFTEEAKNVLEPFSKEELTTIVIGIKDEYSEAKVEAFGLEADIIVKDELQIIEELAERTGLSTNEISSVIKFEIDGEQLAYDEYLIAKRRIRQQIQKDKAKAVALNGKVKNDDELSKAAPSDGVKNDDELSKAIAKDDGPRVEDALDK